MSLDTLLTQTVTVIRWSQATQAADSEGNDLPSTPPSRVDYAGLVQQLTTSEDRTGPDIDTTTHRLFLPPTAVIDGGDRVEESGRLFEIVGAPDVLRTPRGVHHIEALLRLVTD
jgi:hypothetical protein